MKVEIKWENDTYEAIINVDGFSFYVVAKILNVIITQFTEATNKDVTELKKAFIECLQKAMFSKDEIVEDE